MRNKSPKRSKIIARPITELYTWPLLDEPDTAVLEIKSIDHVAHYLVPVDQLAKLGKKFIGDYWIFKSGGRPATPAN